MKANIVNVVGTQWGDEGKGKVIDVIASKADYVVRYQGGNNAGHTVIVNDQKFVLHLLPSGAVSNKTQCIIGAGVVVDLAVLNKEIEQIEKAGKNMDSLLIDNRAHIIMPYHIEIDKLNEQLLGEDKIGTTLRGIGPTYVDKFSRIGIRAEDLLNLESLEVKIDKSLKFKNAILKAHDYPQFKAKEVINQLKPLIDKLKFRITDTVNLLNDATNQDKTIILEGAQALMLDIDHGTYPFVTSSSPTSGGAAIGSGIAGNKINQIIGVAKAYTTRVGQGPFLTELNDEIGNILQTVGHEFGSTTGRPRRCGWLDLVVLKHAVKINGLTDIVLTKLDVLTNISQIKVAIGYKINGQIQEAMPSKIDLENIEVIYETLEGWSEDITKVKKFSDLPINAQKYVNYISEYLNTSITMISVGPERNQNIYCNNNLAKFGVTNE